MSANGMDRTVGPYIGSGADILRGCPEPLLLGAVPTNSRPNRTFRLCRPVAGEKRAFWRTREIVWVVLQPDSGP